MNQSKRRLTGALATTTLLAAAGVGVYQLSQSDMMSNPGRIIGVRDERPLRREDADALAAANQNASVSVTTEEADYASESKDKGSLDALAAAWETEYSDPIEPVVTTEQDSKSPTDLVPVSSPNPIINESKLGERYAHKHNQDSKFAEFNSVTLGQEPTARELAYGSGKTENQETESTNQAAQLRARSAFGDSQVTPAGRYAPAKQTTELAQPYEETQVNPFERQPAPVPAPTTPAQPISAAQKGGLERYDPNENIAPTNVANIQPTQLTPAPRTATLTPSRAEPQFSDNSSTDFNNSARQLVPSQPQTQGAWNDPTSSSTNNEQYGLVAEGEGTGRPGEQALEGPQKPALVMQKLAPAEIQVGKPAKFAIEVRNIGDLPANDVVVRDAIPEGTRVINTMPKAERNNGELIWKLGTLSVGELRDLEIELMPTTEGEIGSVANVTYSAQASVKTRCTMPKLALRLTAPRKVMIGTEQHVRIEIHNPGSGDATGVVLLENVPEELKHQAGPALEFEVGTLRAGETREMELVLTAEKPGLITNRISAHADGNLQVEQELEFEVIAPALELGVNGPRVRYLERPATYKVSVGNPGTAAARDIELVTKLPKGMQFVSANNLGEYDSEQHAVFWSLAELPEGESGEVELVTLPVEPGELELKVEGTARQGLEDETSQPILVEGLAAINFEVIDLQDPIEVGGETTYNIRIVNQGSKAASGVQVTAILPPGMKVISAKGETGHMIQQGGVIFEPLPTLATKADTVYELRVQGVQPGDQRIVVEVDTEDIGQPIRREESTRVFSDQ